MVAKSTHITNAKRKLPPISADKKKAKVKTIKVSLSAARKKATKAVKQAKVLQRSAKAVAGSKVASKQQRKVSPKKVSEKTTKVTAKKTLKQKIEITRKVAGPVRKTKSRSVEREVLNAQNKKPVVNKLLSKLKRLRVYAQTNSLSKKVDAIKSQKVKKAETTDKIAEKTDVALPIYLTTPTKEMLKVFRTAAEKTRRLQIQQRKAKGSGRGFLAKPFKNTKKFSIDLRVHSPATDGYFSTGGVEPAAALVRLAKAKGIDVLAVTDSFSSLMLDEIKKTAEGLKIVILPGLELACRLGYCDDFQLVALFPETFTGDDLSKVLDELGVPIECRGLPTYSLKSDFETVLKIVERRGGIVIPSHVDKTPNRQSTIAQLVDNYGFHCFDLVHPENTDYFKDYWPDGGFTFFSFSNANSLAQVGTRITKVKLVSPTFDGIKQLVERRASS